MGNIIVPNANSPRMLGGQAMMPPPPPSLDEVIEYISRGLADGVKKDLSLIPALRVYGAMNQLLTAPPHGFSKALTSKILSVLKISVPDKFTRHPKYQEILTNMCAIIANLHKATVAEFGEDCEPIFLGMLESRLSLVIPPEIE